MIYTDPLVKVWRKTYLLHYRIIQLESYSEIPKRKSSLDIYTDHEKREISKNRLRSRLLEGLWLLGFVPELLLL